VRFNKGASDGKIATLPHKSGKTTVRAARRTSASTKSVIVTTVEEDVTASTR
jgi:hypothetical protein